jgi:hypothetical protein
MCRTAKHADDYDVELQEKLLFVSMRWLITVGSCYV